MIEIKNLDFHYPRKKQVYKNLNLNIEPGNVYGLLGLNGAGKTTLLNLIAGLLIPQEGSCKVFNMEAKERQAEMLKDVFVVPDISEFPNVRIAEFCQLYAEFYPQFDYEFFKHCIDEFRLAMNLSLKRQSFGDKRKVMLSFALATKCRLLLLDEPTNGLDIPSKGTFRKLMAESIGENQTIILATHLVHDVVNLMDRIIIEHHGKVVINESIETISENLHFGKDIGSIPTEDLIYATEGISTKETVSANYGDNPGRVDIELLLMQQLPNRTKFQEFSTSKISTMNNVFLKILKYEFRMNYMLWIYYLIIACILLLFLALNNFPDQKSLIHLFSWLLIFIVPMAMTIDSYSESSSKQSMVMYHLIPASRNIKFFSKQFFTLVLYP